MQEWLPSFVEELTKLALEDLPPSQRAKQYLQFGALGSAMGPVMGGLGNLIQRSRITPEGIPLRRWLPAQMTTGALIGGALPVMRDLLARSNIEKVHQQQAAQNLLKSMAPEGPEKALRKLRRREKVLEL